MFHYLSVIYSAKVFSDSSEHLELHISENVEKSGNFKKIYCMICGLKHTIL